MATRTPIPLERSIYGRVVYDSEIDGGFARTLDGMEGVKFLLKLRGWFTVPTPIGAYNPDWAIVWQRQVAFGEAQDKLYLVRETKSSRGDAARRGTENMKIACARWHFGTIEVNHGHAMSADELRERSLLIGGKQSVGNGRGLSCWLPRISWMSGR